MPCENFLFTLSSSAALPGDRTRLPEIIAASDHGDEYADERPVTT
jgi:hypothetical protein